MLQSSIHNAAHHSFQRRVTRSRSVISRWRDRDREQVVRVITAGGSMAKERNVQKDATMYTKAANRLVLERLPFANQSAYSEARRGEIELVEDLVIEGPNGPVWSLLKYRDQMPYPPPPPCPDTVNPSLWRQATLNSVAGLFTVVDDAIYQVRAYDMSNMTIIEGDTGVIIIDPLISNECAAAALALYRRHRRNSGRVV